MKEKIENKINNCIDFLYKYRYVISIIIFLFCIIFEISGSSIGLWGPMTGNKDNGLLFGISRAVRSDEWGTLTPMTFSQYFSNFKFISPSLRGGNTNVFLIYALPVFTIFQLFRPFQLGFLFLGMAKGLSFFWCGRFIALFLTTLELCMIITKKNKLLSYVGALMVTLAPIIQWWFAVNGIVEIFVFGQLLIILLYKYMKDDNFKNRCIYLFLMVICAGGYILVFYPAWQIPMAYVFLALAIWVLIENIKECKIKLKDIISIVIAIFILVLSLGYIFYNSMDVIKIILNTSYPGARLELGGLQLNKYFSYIINIFLPYKSNGILGNQCEAALMFSLFPIGIILSIYLLIKNKFKDKFLLIILVFYTFLSIWCIYGFPKPLAKISLLYLSQSGRSILAVGYLDILILLRCMNELKPVKRIIALIASILLSILVIRRCYGLNANYLNHKFMIIIMIITLIYLFYFIFRYNKGICKYLFVLGIIPIMIMMGMPVNPIRHGVDVIYKTDLMKEIKKVDKDNKKIWISDEMDYPMNNYPILAGKKLINGTNTYPNLELWKKIDKKGKYKDIYNRYAHIRVYVSDNALEKFELVQPDLIKVYLSTKDLKKLNVKYIFTNRDLSTYSDSNITFKNIYNKNYKIYELKY